MIHHRNVLLMMNIDREVETYMTWVIAMMMRDIHCRNNNIVVENIVEQLNRDT